MKTLVTAVLMAVLCTVTASAKAQEIPVATGTVSTVLVNESSIGKYVGNFVNTRNPTNNPMGMEFTISSLNGGAVSGAVVLYGGSCRGESYQFSGTFEGSRIKGTATSPARCPADLKLDAELKDGRITGGMVGSNQYAVELRK